MPPPKGPRTYFPHVKEAREALKARALELFDLQVRIVQDALAAQQFEVAAKANQWLIEHMPSDEGVSMIDGSVDKPKQIEGKTGPQINIGFQLGGVSEQKKLPEPVIDVEPELEDHS